MHLVQVLLPLFDNSQQPLPHEHYDAVRHELTEKFGGLTSYTRAPAEGVWLEEPAKASRDDIVIFEVMTEALDAGWWSKYRQSLEMKFRQQQVIVRVHEIRLL